MDEDEHNNTNFETFENEPAKTYDNEQDIDNCIDKIKSALKMLR